MTYGEFLERDAELRAWQKARRREFYAAVWEVIAVIIAVIAAVGCFLIPWVAA